MKSYDKIASDFSRDCGKFLATSHRWRNESSFMYQIKDSRPVPVSGGAGVTPYALDKPELRPGGGRVQSGQSLRNMNLSVVSLAPALLNACVGMMTQYRQGFSAHNVDPSFRGEADLMDDGIEWSVRESNFDPVLTEVVTDCMVRGVGAMDISLDDHNRRYPLGAPSCEHKHHIFFDRSRQQGATSTNMAFCGYGDPVYKDELDAYVDSVKVLSEAGASFRSQFLEYTQPEDEQEIDFLYNYFWHEFEDVRVVENLFVTKPEMMAEMMDVNPLAYEAFADFGINHQLDFARSPTFNLAPDAWNDFLRLGKNFEYLVGRKMPEPEVQKTRQRVYYRARFANNKLILASQSYTKTSHPLKIFTGYYDRMDGVYYGMMRRLAYVQEMLDDSVSDWATYAHRSATGGTVAVSGLGTEMRAVINSIKDNEQVILTPENSQARSLGSADAGQTMASFSQWLVEVMPSLLGVDRSILGQLNSDTPAASLYRDVQKQMRVSMSHIMDKLDIFLTDCGDTFADMVTLLIQSHGDLKIPNFNAESGAETYTMLSQENIARNYVMRLVSRDITDDERHEEFMKLFEMTRDLMPEQKVAVLPILIEASSLDDKYKEQITQALSQQITPEQAQAQAQAQEVQRQQALSQIRLTNAQAMQLESTAQREIAGAQEDMAQAEVDRRKALVEIDRAAADIEHKEAQADKAKAEAAKTISEIGMGVYDRFNSQFEVRL